MAFSKWRNVIVFFIFREIVKDMFRHAYNSYMVCLYILFFVFTCVY
jgi:hypothetical protein